MSSAAIEDAPGVVVDKRYRIGRLIGVGGMGSVYEADHLALGSRVAVKFPAIRDAAGKERFIREAWAAARLQGENVVRILDLGIDDGGLPYLAMELLEGRSLSTWIDEEDLSVDEALDVTIQACRGVAEAHSRGIIHRDIKPNNLFVSSRFDGSMLVKVLDFGLAKATDELEVDALTRTDQVLGTASYMPPEQMTAFKHVGPAADVWALGIVLYECLTGHVPFDAASYPELCAKVLTALPTPLPLHCPTAPPELAAIVDRCLAKDPAHRYADAAELGRALSTVRSKLSTAPPPHEAELAQSNIRFIAPRLPSVGPYQGPSGWPIIAPGVALAFLGSVRVLYLDGRASDEVLDRMFMELERAIVDAPEDEKMVWFTHCPVPVKLAARHGAGLTDVLKRHAQKLEATVAMEVIVAPSATTRGMIQALDWVAPRKYPRSVVATTAEGISILADRLGMTAEEFEMRYEALIGSL